MGIRKCGGNVFPALAAGLLALAVFLFFLEAPGLGDDTDYWGLAFDLHRGVENAWSPHSFHHFRWPVWWPMWLAMAAGFEGMASYYLEPLVYFVGSAIVVFLLGRKSGLEVWSALAAVVFYTLNPFLDPTFSRPMPDLSEGFWIGLALLCWLWRPGWLVGNIVCGICLWLAFANRVTGVFGIVAFGGAALLCSLSRWRELFVVAAAAIAALLVEWSLWAVLAGDFLAVIHANLGGTGRAGTESMDAGDLLTRFLILVFKEPAGTILAVLAILGAVGAFTTSARLRPPALLCGIQFLIMTSAVQGLDPLQPMLRTTGRFLGMLAPVWSVVAAGGLALLMGLLGGVLRRAPAGDRIRSVLPGLALVGMVVIFFCLTEREREREKFPREMAAMIRQAKEGSRVLADPAFYWLANLCAGAEARKLVWTLEKQMVVSTPELERLAEHSDHVWFRFSNIWNWVRMDIHSGKLRAIDRLASFLDPQRSAFAPQRVVVWQQQPEFVFLERTNTPPWKRSESAGFSLSGNKGDKQRGEMPVSATNVCVALTFRIEADHVRPLRMELDFESKGRRIQRLECEPPGFPAAAPFTIFFEVPAASDRAKWTLKSTHDWSLSDGALWLDHG